MVATAQGARPAALPEDDDVELVAAVRRGDDHAFERLYARYHRRIAAYVRGMVKDYARAEDITQEVFISALRRLRSSDQTIVLKPWLYEIARNACIDQYRRTQRAPEVLLDADAPDSEPLISIGPTPDIEVDTKQKLDHLRHAFSGLSEVQHEVLVMRELEGRSYREIGERLNLTRPAVESALFRARRRLMEEYEDLSSGSRCIRVQRAINLACSGTPGTRDRWRIASHVSHCHVCRRHARVSGLSPELTPSSLPARVAAVLPLPAFLRRFLAARTPRLGAVHPEHVSSLANMASAVGSASEPFSGWITAGAVAATVALAIGGSSVIGISGSSHHPAAAPVAAARAGHSAAPAAPAAAKRSRRAPATGVALRAARSGPSAQTPSGSTPLPAPAAKPHAPATTHSPPPGGSSGGLLAGTQEKGAPTSSAPIGAPPVHTHLAKTLAGAVAAVGSGSAASDTSKSVPSAVTTAPAQVQKAAQQTVQDVTGTATTALPKPPAAGG